VQGRRVFCKSSICGYARTARLDPLVAHLTQLSPLKILNRGYAIVTTESGAIVKVPAEAPEASKIGVRLAHSHSPTATLRRAS